MVPMEVHFDLIYIGGVGMGKMERESGGQAQAQARDTQHEIWKPGKGNTYSMERGLWGGSSIAKYVLAWEY